MFKNFSFTLSPFKIHISYQCHCSFHVTAVCKLLEDHLNVLFILQQSHASCFPFSSCFNAKLSYTQHLLAIASNFADIQVRCQSTRLSPRKLKKNTQIPKTLNEEADYTDKAFQHLINNQRFALALLSTIRQKRSCTYCNK